MRPVLWTARAQEDLLRIADYIAMHNVSAAIKLTQKIRQSVLSLANFPYYVQGK